MTARLRDIAITKNAGWSKVLTFYTKKDRSATFDLTGYTGKAQLRAGQSRSSNLLADISVAVVSPATGGQVRLTLTHAQIATISQTSGWFDVLLAYGSADPVRICYAYVTIGEGETEWVP